MCLTMGIVVVKLVNQMKAYKILFLVLCVFCASCSDHYDIDKNILINGDIAFCGKEMNSDRFDIYLLDLATGNVKNLTKEFIYNLDNSFGHSIGCSDDMLPYRASGLEWSPSGNLLILNAGEPFLTIPYVMEISPSGKVLNIARQRAMSPDEANILEWPNGFSWSSSEDMVAFVGVNSPDGYQNLFIGDLSKWENSAATGEIVQITNIEQDWPGIVYSPAWSPDGQSIAVSINRHSSGVAIFSKDGESSIFVTNENHIQLSSVSNPTDPWVNAKPSWFPDSKSLVFIGAISKDSRTALFSINNDGTELRLLIPDGVSNPVVSPSGDSIAYIEYSSHEINTIGRIVGVDTDGGNKRILATVKPDKTFDFKKYYIRDLSWSPDGKYLIFTSNISGQFQLYLVTNDGAQFLQITNFNGDAVNPLWRPENHDNLLKPTN